MRRGLIAIAVLLGLAVPGWLIISPYMYLRQLRAAVESGDTEVLAELIDFPSVRESIKDELNAAIVDSMQGELEGNPFAPLGMMLASAMVERLVEAYVSPAGLAALSRGDPPKIEAIIGQQQDDVSSESRYRIVSAYKSFSRFDISFWSPKSNREELVFVLRRSGLGWRLTAIRMPVFRAEEN